MSSFAYHFRHLRIDLSREASTVLPLDPDFLQNAIGGSGLGVGLLSQTDSAELDPFAPASSLFFVFSPLVGSPLTTSAKFAVVSKSPLTHRINDSLAGSGFAIAGKKTGFDAIEIRGQAREPVVIVIENNDVRIVPCPGLWGTQLSECQQKLRDEFGSRFKTACIGPAGENKVLYATISHDGRHAGRGGSGAVLGSKNVKAILVAGNQKVAWAHPERLNQYAKSLSKRSFEGATAKYRELGTAANLLAFNRLQCLPTRNFNESQFEAAENLAPETIATDRKKTRSSCAACTIGCEHIYEIRPSQNSKTPKVRMEYESLFALGPMCGLSDADKVLEAAHWCDELGLDTVSTGGTLAFAMDCAERGLIDEPLRFGDAEAVIDSIQNIALRQGFGDSLALGSRKLAQQIGGNSIDFAPQIKGLEIPGYDPRKLSTMALGFAVGTRGADHNKSSAYEIDFGIGNDAEQASRLTEAKIDQAIFLEDKSAVMDSLIFCKFLRHVFDDFFEETAEVLNMACGWNMDATLLRSIGNQIVDSKKAFNIRAGWTPEEDRLPEMIFQKPVEFGQATLSKEELQQAISMYNLKRGWTTDGFLQ